MKDHQSSLHEPQESEEEAMARLLGAAGPRPVVSADAKGRLRAAAELTWMRKVRQRRQSRRRALAAWTLAAAAVLTVAVALSLRNSSSPSIPAAHLLAKGGSIRLEEGSRSQELALGTTVFGGAVVETGSDSYAAFQLAGGSSLRLHGSTRLRWISATRMELLEGRIYVDSGPVDSPDHGDAVAIETVLGVARDIGTQFEIQLIDDALLLRVREGAVVIENDHDTYQVVAGAGLRVTASGEVERTQTASYGPAWAWVLGAAPAFELEGRSVAEFLAWIEREAGWKIEYADEDVAQEASESLFGPSGSTAGLSPAEALELIVTSGLTHRLEEGRVIVGGGGS